MCGFIAQLVEQRTGNAEVTGSNPVEALKLFFFFFRLLLSNGLNWKICCDDHSSLSSATAVQNKLFHMLHRQYLATKFSFFFFQLQRGYFGQTHSVFLFTHAAINSTTNPVLSLKQRKNKNRTKTLWNKSSQVV